MTDTNIITNMLKGKSASEAADDLDTATFLASLNPRGDTDALRRRNNVKNHVINTMATTLILSASFGMHAAADKPKDAALAASASKPVATADTSALGTMPGKL